VKPVLEDDGFIGKARDSAQIEAPRPHVADHDTAAGGAEVDGGDGDGGHGDYRRKAAATPASTGMCRPVVWVRSGPTSAYTALATWSGRTSRFSSVRWA
jgi:hypothetical protein